MNRQTKKWAKFFIKICVSAAIIAYVFSVVDFSALVAALSRLSGGVLLIAVFLQFGSVLLNATKWNVLLPEFQWLTLVRFTFVGQLYALVLPGQLLGEAAKAYRLGGEGAMARVASSVVLDKVTGLVGLLLVTAYGLWVTSLAIPGYILFIVLFSAVILSALPFVILVQSFHHFLASFLAVAGRISLLRTSAVALESFIKEENVHARQPLRIVGSVFFGVLFQFLTVYITMFLAQHLGIEVRFGDWCWMFGVVSILVLLPVTVAGIGVRELSMIGLLSVFGISGAVALALSLNILANVSGCVCAQS